MKFGHDCNHDFGCLLKVEKKCQSLELTKVRDVDKLEIYQRIRGCVGLENEEIFPHFLATTHVSKSGV